MGKHMNALKPYFDLQIMPIKVLRVLIAIQYGIYNKKSNFRAQTSI